MTSPKPSRLPLILICTALLCAAPAWAETGPLPDGWRLPVAGEMDAPFRAYELNRYLRAAADFDGDGAPDTALVLVSETIGPRGHPAAIGAFAFLSQPGGSTRPHPVHILEHPLPVDFRQFGIMARPPGRYVTACGAGYGDGCAPGEPDAVVLETAGLECGLFESVTGLYRWNPLAGRFDGVPISD